MTNIYLNTTDSSETFTDSQVLEMNEAISKAVDEEMARQCPELTCSKR